MVKVVKSTVINAPVEAVWAVLRDFNGHDQWHPAVADSIIKQLVPGTDVAMRCADEHQIRFGHEMG